MATYKPIQSVVLTSSSTGVTFSGIDQTYTDLVVVFNGSGTSDVGIGLQFNEDTSTSLYSYTRGYGDGANAYSDRETSRNACYFGIIGTNQSTAIAHILNYSSTTTSKTVLGRGNSTVYSSIYASLWRNTNAITSITVIANTFPAGSTFDLYGIKSGAPQALGGDVVTTDGNYWYHAFRTTGAFTPQRSLTADVLVIAGGGSSGGNWVPGGGGAGGLRGLSSQVLDPKNYTITVGAGGAYPVTNGVNSSISASGFSTISASGGGFGGTAAGAANGASGGSGGGGYGSATGSETGLGGAGNIGSYSPVEGFAGSPGNVGGTYQSGGGGGATATPTTPTGNAGGPGGAGSSAYSSWASATGTGVSGAYAGGGGGSGESSGGTGGAGGGGNGRGRNSGTTTSGTANSGGGGGGGFTGSQNGGNGGSGLVIVRYPV